MPGSSRSECWRCDVSASSARRLPAIMEYAWPLSVQQRLFLRVSTAKIPGPPAADIIRILIICLLTIRAAGVRRCPHAGSQDPKECRMARAPDSPRKASSAKAPALPPSMRERVPFLLYRAAETSHSLANTMLAEIALNARQAGILTMVTELGPMTQKGLGDALRIDRTTMVALLDDLEEKGYVTRQRHPRDRRAFLVRPTDSGRVAKLDAVRILDEQQHRFLQPLTIAERRVLAGLLRRLYEGLASGPA
jgi:MarR family transcriptional regulator, lower aerobic nicotinate degradation pathway regulator